MTNDGTPYVPLRPGIFEDVAAAAQDLGREMRACVAPLLSDQPSIREFALALGIDKSLAWHVRRIATACEPIQVLTSLPGHAGMASAVRALHDAGRDTAALDASRAALMQVLQRRGISRAQLKSMAHADPTRTFHDGVVRQLHRRAYVANAAVHGRSIGGVAMALMLIPSDTAHAVSLVASTMIHQLVRTSPTGPTSVYYRGKPRADHPHATQRIRFPTASGSQHFMVPHLCSPEVGDDQLSLVDYGHGEVLCYDPPASSASRVDFAFRELFHGVSTRAPMQPASHGFTGAFLPYPVEHMCIDVMLHPSMCVSDLQAALYLRSAPVTAYHHDPEFLRYPVSVTVRKATSPELPRAFIAVWKKWIDLIEASAALVGMRAHEFNTHRICLECPPTPSDVRMRWHWNDKAQE